MKTLPDTLNTRRIFGGGSGITRLIGYLAEYRSLARPATVLLMTALLLPLIYVGSSRPVAASRVSAAPVAAASPPVSGSGGFALLPNTPLLAALAINQEVISGYQSVADFFVPPPLPSGLAMAQMPTLWDKISALPAAALLLVFPNGSSAAASLPMRAAAATTFDFDGDGRADVSRWRDGVWKIRSSDDGSITTSAYPGIGTAIAPADYDGDGTTDRAVFTDYEGKWQISNGLSTFNNALTITGFGSQGDKAVCGDYDGDGAADLAVYRFTDNAYNWYVRKSNGTVDITSMGLPNTTPVAGAIPVPGDYNGDGKIDFAVFRPDSSGYGWWDVLFSTGTAGTYSFATFQWGYASDTPVPADYDGDGKTDLAVYRPGSGTWHVIGSRDGYMTKTWGNYGDQPVPADYDGDRKADFAVWRPTTGVWYITNSSYVANTGTVVAQIAQGPEYTYYQLGTAGDLAVPSAYLKQTGAELPAYKLANARLAPINATGGTDLYSRNFSWGTSLVNLPGRAGLDLNLGISYNSLVWTKETNSSVNTLVFDADHANVTPGFNFGFPTIEPAYYNGLTGKISYLMVTPSGGRVEFRQNAASNIYEAEDSSYAQLTVNYPSLLQNGPPSFVPQPPRNNKPEAEDLTMTVTTTDGTQMDYDWKAGAYRLNRIKDRNGNFITVAYDEDYGLLQSVTDTLGREITVEYYNDEIYNQFYPTAIKQSWNSGNGDGTPVTHTYATFSYSTATINPNFASGIGVFGPSGGKVIKVLNRVEYPNGNSTTFEYNKYGQVWRVRQVAADSTAHELNVVWTDLQDSSSTQPSTEFDCPRFTKTSTKVENFNGGVPTVVHNTVPAVSGAFTAGGESISNISFVDVTMESAPHGISSRQWYYPAGNWAEGLPLGTEDFADGSRQRWTRTVWTQDILTKKDPVTHEDVTLTYKVNPRVTESKVGDQSNIKKTVIQYLPAAQNSPISQFGLVSKVQVYDGAAGTLMKEATTGYNSSAAYLSRRIIGLPSKRELYDGGGNLLSKTTYDYDNSNDNGDFSGAGQNIPSVIQHDTANYGAGFIVGRGNTTQMTRCDVDLSSAATCGGGISSQIKYNTAGSVVAQLIPGSTTGATRQVSIGYADVFNDTTTSRNTYAYPTTLTDPAVNSSSVKYRFDTGENVWAQSPAPQGSATGKTSERFFDSTGRIEKQSVSGGAYARYVYSPNQTLVTTFATMAAGQGETKSESYTDGAGRVTASRAAFSWSGANVATWSGQLTEYDILGQQKRQTPPTEITDGWQPTNKDNRGANVWLWTNQTYDWKGRVTQITNADGTTKEITYDGCGCAGGEVVTVKGEEIIEKDWQGNPGNNLGRRTQRTYSDVLGRTSKSEILNWNGTVYSTVVNTFNARDQITMAQEYTGAEGSGSVQTTNLNYDGHGRLISQHTPEQDAGAATVFEYFNDDQLKKKTDARGVVSNYLYGDARGLLTQINYQVPSGTSGNPYIDSANKFVSNSQVTVTGGNFDTDVQVKFGNVTYPGGGAPPVYDSGTIYSGTQLTRGTSPGGQATLTFDYSPAITANMYIQVISPGANKQSEKVLSTSAGSYWVFYGGGDLYGIPQTPTVDFEYDALGNRKKMTDGQGWVDYTYDQLSHLASENRHFTNITNASAADGNYKISYEYALSGGLKSITDPFSARIDYTVDKSGLTTAVTGAVAFADKTNYATDLRYRAWGAMQHLKYGDDSVLDVDYDSKLNPSQYNLSNAGGTRLMGADYKYWGDGRLQFVDDAGNDRFDRKYVYDQVGRLTLATSGTGANGDSAAAGPYGLSFNYNAFGNLTNRSNHYWYSGTNAEFATTYTNNRNQSADWVYDADGQAVSSRTAPASPYSSWSYTHYLHDAAGQSVSYDGQQDGDGLEIEKINSNIYYVRSSVLGGSVISEVYSETGVPAYAGMKVSTYVYLGGQVIAEQQVNNNTQSQSIYWKEKDPLGTSVYVSSKQLALDPSGISTDTPDPAMLSQYPSYYSQMYNSNNYGYGNYGAGQGAGYSSGSPYSYGGGIGGTPGNPQVCTFEGTRGSCDEILSQYGNGGVLQTETRDGNRRYLADVQNLGAGIFVTPRVNVSPGNARSDYLPIVTVSLDLVQVGSNNNFQQQTREYQTKKPQKANFDELKLKICVKDLFKTEVRNWSWDPSGGTFEGYSELTKTYYNYVFNSSGNGVFNVNTSTELNATQVSSKVDFFGYRTAGKIVFGATDTKNPNNNWVSKDYAGGEFGRAKWVYELGNALGAITNRSNKITVQDPRRYANPPTDQGDIGGALEDCVYGGAVQQDGTLWVGYTRY